MQKMSFNNALHYLEQLDKQAKGVEQSKGQFERYKTKLKEITTYTFQMFDEYAKLKLYVYMAERAEIQNRSALGQQKYEGASASQLITLHMEYNYNRNKLVTLARTLELKTCWR